MKIKQEPKTLPSKKESSEEGERDQALEQELFAGLVQPLRGTDERKERRNKLNASDETIETAFVSPFVLSGIAKAQNAFVVEHWPGLLKKLFGAAENGQSWAWRILLDVAGVSEQMRAACSGTLPGEMSEIERSLPEEIRELLEQADEETTPADPASTAN